MINDFSTIYGNIILLDEYDSEWIGPGNQRVWDQKNNPNLSYFDLDGYLITKDVGDGKIINQNINFDYKINKNGFRSQHFKRVEENKITLLTAGCSQSFGEGLPDNLRWQNLLLNNINNLNVELFDVSSMGASPRLIVRNITSFIRNYGAPNYIFVVFPDIARDFLFHDNDYCFQNVTFHTKFLTEPDSIQTVSHKRYALRFDEHDALMSFMEQIWFLEELCRFANIRLYWTTHDLRLHNIINKNFKYNNFISIDSKKIDIDRENIKNLEYWDVANDNAHYGSSWTSGISDIFFERFIND